MRTQSHGNIYYINRECHHISNYTFHKSPQPAKAARRVFNLLAVVVVGGTFYAYEFLHQIVFSIFLVNKSQQKQNDNSPLHAYLTSQLTKSQTKKSATLKLNNIVYLNGTLTYLVNANETLWLLAAEINGQKQYKRAEE